MATVNGGKCNSASAAFLQAMEVREVKILSNPAFLSAIYMDPRYQCLLKESQKIVAKAHLNAVWKRLSSMDTGCDSELMNKEQSDVKDL